MSLEKIEIYTDGSCIGNPGPGGWAFILIHEGKAHKSSGGEKDTTNNRMEMMAMVKALVYAKKLCDDDAKLKNSQIILHSDSNLLVQSLNLGWKRKANLDLWEKLDAARADLNVKYVWVKAHAQNCHNNAVDLLAFSAAIKIKKS